MKMKVELEKNNASKNVNVIHGRKPFITSNQKASENNLRELLGNDYGYSEGTICLVNR